MLLRRILNVFILFKTVQIKNPFSCIIWLNDLECHSIIFRHILGFGQLVSLGDCGGHSCGTLNITPPSNSLVPEKHDPQETPVLHQMRDKMREMEAKSSNVVIELPTGGQVWI